MSRTPPPFPPPKKTVDFGTVPNIKNNAGKHKNTRRSVFFLKASPACGRRLFHQKKKNTDPFFFGGGGVLDIREGQRCQNRPFFFWGEGGFLTLGKVNGAKMDRFSGGRGGFRSKTRQNQDFNVPGIHGRNIHVHVSQEHILTDTRSCLTEHTGCHALGETHHVQGSLASFARCLCELEREPQSFEQQRPEQMRWDGEFRCCWAVRQYQTSIPP